MLIAGMICPRLLGHHRLRSPLQAGHRLVCKAGTSRVLDLPLPILVMSSGIPDWPDKEAEEGDDDDLEEDEGHHVATRPDPPHPDLLGTLVLEGGRLELEQNSRFL